MLARWAVNARVCQRAGWLGAAIACCAFASAGSLHALDLKACTDAQNSSAALRECTALLQSPGVSDQDRIGLYLKRGQAWLSEEEPAETVADCTHILAIDAAHEQALILRARANTALGAHKLAAEDWTAVIGLTGGEISVNENAHLERASSWLAAGNSDAALADYDKIVATNPKSIKAHLGRANVFVTMNDREQALAEFARAQAIDPQNTAPYIARAEAAERWGDTKMAIENYLVVVRNNTRSAGPYRKALQRLGVDTPP